MMYRFVLTLFSGLMIGGVLAPSLRAQTAAVTGTVVDADGLPLPGANVVVESTTQGSAAGLDGSYTVGRLPAGPATLVASAVGYTTVREPIVLVEADTLRVDFVLARRALQGEEVVVTAARRAQALGSVPVSLSVLPTEALAERNIVTLDDALRLVPGVQLADNQVSIRGSSGFSYNTGSRVLLLLDGMPLLSPDRESLPLNALPMSQVERIEVVKGPGSALYGGNALGGVINVLTRDFPASPETAAQLFAGAYEPVRHRAWRSGWDEASSPRPMLGATLSHARSLSPTAGFWVNAAYRRDDGYLQEGAEQQADVFGKLGWDVSPRIRLTTLAGWTRRRADAFLYWNGLDDPLTPGTLSFFETDGDSRSGSNDNLSDWATLHVALRQLLSPRLFYTVRTRAYGALIRPLDEAGRPRDVEDGTLGARYGGEVQVNWEPRSDAYLTAGLAADALATQSSFFQDADAPVETRAQPEAALFAQWEQPLGAAFEVVAGLRYDAYWLDTGVREDALSPKLNVGWSPAEAVHVRASYGRGFRVPSLAERFVNNGDFFPVVLNLDLRPELSTGYEVGVRAASNRIPSLSLSADVAGFWTHYRRLVEPVFFAELQAFQFVNLTSARVRGLEAEAQVGAASGRWTLRAGYQFLDADDLTSEEPLAFRSRHLATVAATADLWRGVYGGLDARLASAFERVDSDFARFVPDADVTTPIRVLDARLGVRAGRLGAALIVRNVLDYYYVERPAILAPPRSLVVQLSARR